VLLVAFAVRAEHVYQRQIAGILIAVVTPWVANAIFLFGPVSLAVDLTPVSFAITGMALWWTIFSQDFLEIVPVARSTVVDNINAGVFVLDRQNKVVDINQTGRELLELENVEVIGQDAASLLAGFPAVQKRFKTVSDSFEEIDTQVTFGTNPYRVQISPLYDRRDVPIGRLFLVSDITEQKRRQRELERQNEQLERFANVVSHDLRNPLNVASGKLELGMATDDPDHFEAVADAHERMNRIIDDVLEIARQGQQVGTWDRVSLAAIATDAWETVEKARATLEIEGDRELDANEARLRRAFENLFRNALEHGGAEVTVRVGATEDGFFVADDGPGIPPADRPSVFDEGFTTEENGTGFGLAIVQSIVEAHGWEIDVRESAAGGARFDISDVPPVADTQPPDSQEPDPVTPSS